MTQLETLLFPNQGTGNESPTQRYTHFLTHAVFLVLHKKNLNPFNKILKITFSRHGKNNGVVKNNQINEKKKENL